MDIQEFKEGIFSLRTRRFGTVAEYMIKVLISVEMSSNLAYDLTDSEMNRSEVFYGYEKKHVYYHRTKCYTTNPSFNR